MFGRKRRRIRTTATVASATFVRDVGQWGQSEFEFVVDVAPTDGAPFRQTVRQRALDDQHPEPGDVVSVLVDPRDRSVALDLDDDPRYRTQDPAEAHAFNQRCAANLDEVAHLEKTGHKATAVLTEVTECGWMRALGQREFAVAATVSPPDGQPYEAHFSIFDTTAAGLYTPAVGQTIGVVFDPADRSMVRAGTFWSSPGLETFESTGSTGSTGPILELRWHVPAECPNCGAPVDQSTESMAPHPACHMCHAPLPCEPV